MIVRWPRQGGVEFDVSVSNTILLSCHQWDNMHDKDEAIAEDEEAPVMRTVALLSVVSGTWLWLSPLQHAALVQRYASLHLPQIQACVMNEEAVR